jgi:hypothetical protein
MLFDSALHSYICYGYVSVQFVIFYYSFVVVVSINA